MRKYNGNKNYRSPRSNRKDTEIRPHPLILFHPLQTSPHFYLCEEKNQRKLLARTACTNCQWRQIGGSLSAPWEKNRCFSRQVTIKSPPLRELNIREAPEGFFLVGIDVTKLFNYPRVLKVTERHALRMSSFG